MMGAVNTARSLPEHRCRPIRYSFRMDIRARLRDPATEFGFVMSKRLGDSLVSMVIAENLRRAGRSVTIYGDMLHPLESRFPAHRIESVPRGAEAVARWKRHDVLLHFRPADVREEAGEIAERVLVLDDLPEHRGPLLGMVELHRQVSKTLFGVPAPTCDAGFEPLTIRPGAEASRIMIHPTASDPSRQWIPDRFIAVADELRRRGWTPEFTTLPEERSATPWIEAAGFPRFASRDLSELTVRLEGSAGFFGSDSGVAHLASCVGLPFLTLYVRRKVSIRWRPGWSRGEALRPGWPLVFKPLKERFWARAISVGQVLAAADRVFGKAPGVAPPSS